ncbi:hypothetical protein V7S57_02580 [Caulobacter sp. CCNWLY153]|uniref:hypothetical protein n=1 Tax=unclassified Caulobacter TaxID=2648921 RepID=UPI002FF332D3
MTSISGAPRPLEDRLRELIGEGLCYSLAVQVFAEHQRQNEPHLSAYLDATGDKTSEGEIEIDGDAIVSDGGDGGAYVSAWVWVSDAEAGIKRESACDDEDDADAA